MFDSLTGVLTSLKQNQYIKSMSNNLIVKYQKIRQQISTKLKFIQITDNLFYMSYPSLQQIQQLKDHIGTSQFQIWNLSQYRYDSHLELTILDKNQDGQIHNLCYQYYTNIPFYQLIMALKSISNFKGINSNNKVYVHCQDNKIRSGIFLACYMYQYKINNINDIGQSIEYINKLLSINIEDHNNIQRQYFSLKNQHLIFKNYINYHNNSNVINQTQLKLLKIIINNIPLINNLNHIDLQSNLKISLQIRCGQSILLKKLYSSQYIQSNCICIRLQKMNIIISDQFLIMFKYVYNGNIYNLFRLQLNTNFIFHNNTRIQQQDIDLSECCVSNNLMHLDLIFDNLKEISKLAKVKGNESYQMIQNSNGNKINNKNSNRSFINEVSMQKQDRQDKFIEDDTIQTKKGQNDKLQISQDMFDIMNETELNNQDQLNKKILKAMKNAYYESQTQQNFDKYIKDLEEQL